MTHQDYSLLQLDIAWRAVRRLKGGKRKHSLEG